MCCSKLAFKICSRPRCVGTLKTGGGTAAARRRRPPPLPAAACVCVLRAAGTSSLSAATVLGFACCLAARGVMQVFLAPLGLGDPVIIKPFGETPLSYPEPKRPIAQAYGIGDGWLARTEPCALAC